MQRKLNIQQELTQRYMEKQEKPQQTITPIHTAYGMAMQPTVRLKSSSCQLPAKLLLKVQFPS
jgi:hypothetical protein